MTIRALGMALLLLTTSAPAAHAQWAIFEWMEKPASNGPSALARVEDRTEFLQTVSFNPNDYNEESWEVIRQNLREGDIVAYRKGSWEARFEIFLMGKLNKIPYRLFKYGHLAMVVKNPNDENALRLLSSWSFRGPNIEEDLDSLRNHSWDVYRLNHWERVDKKRFYEFIRLVREKAEKWYGYDFAGMFGLWNSNLQPNQPEEIGRSYICSTVIVATLHYAGVDLDAYQRFGIADIVTPFQLVTSKGRIVAASTTAPTLP